MFRRVGHMSLVQLLNPQLRHVGNDKSLLALDALWDIYALAIDNIELSIERQGYMFLTYIVPELNVGDKVLVRNHTRDVWDPKYDAVYCMVWVMGRQLELIDESTKTGKVNAQDVKPTYPADELIKCLPDEKAFWSAAKYCAHPKNIEDLCWSLNPNVLPDSQDYNTGSPSLTVNNDQITHSMSDWAIKQQRSWDGSDKWSSKFKKMLNPTHTYNLHSQRPVTQNKWLMHRYTSKILDSELLYY